jgi:hypothetical protein
MPPKKTAAERKAERDVQRRTRARREGTSIPLPRQLASYQRTGRLTMAQQNRLRSQEALGPVRSEISKLTLQMQSPGLPKSQWKELDSKYQKLYKWASRLQQVIDNPGDFFWEDQKWKNKPRPPPGGSAGGGIYA